MAKKSIQEINAGSMADIAFLLLLFFLVTTTLDTDMGIPRKLPPNSDIIPPVVHDRDVLKVLVNRDNMLLVEDKYLDVSELRKFTKEFILNSENKSNLPLIEEREYPFVGTLQVTPNHVISLCSHRGTSFKTFIAVQNELTAAYNELRDELSMEKWGIPYKDLNPKYREIVADIYKLKISEAEPIRIASNE